ncbi:MAG: lipocalin-like domain-containing protein [Candidatus Sumerlaeia bacterium]|nr:lipocalin-like domain-containing protein [Candidatus Sumerlaeia bacterium]
MKRVLCMSLLLVSSGICAVIPSEEGYKVATPGYSFTFPRDHGIHPDYKTEWWYFTGNLESESGREFGYQYTLFRHQIIAPNSTVHPLSPLKARELYLVHFAVSDISNKVHAKQERLGRPGIGHIRASEERMDLVFEDWVLVQSDETEVISLTADTEGSDFGVQFEMKPIKPITFHGDGGVHVKSFDPSQASYYYSYTRLETKGTIRWKDEVIPVQGLSWMDHEFGSSWLSKNEVGWDWAALQLENGVDIMLYQIRTGTGEPIPFSEGTVILPNGETHSLLHDERTFSPTRFWVSQETGGRYPVEWSVRIPKYEAELSLSARFDEQEMRTTRSTGATYWEGAIKTTGTWMGEPTYGKGYLELVGYTGAMTPLSASRD